MIKVDRKKVNPFLTEMGIVYFRLSGDGLNQMLLVCLEQAHGLLEQCVENCFCTADEAAAAEKKMAKGGLSPTEADFFKLIAAQPLPDNFHSDFNFKVCHSCGNPRIHGYVHDKDDDAIGKPIFTMQEGFSFCSTGVVDKHISLSTAIFLFRQMLAANLPNNDKEREERYQALPEDVRKADEESQERARRNRLSLLESLQGLLPGGDVKVLMITPDGSMEITRTVAEESATVAETEKK